MANPPNIELLFGPFLLGTFVNMILYGILVVQTYFYYQTYKKDTPWIKYLVLYVFLVETINTGCDMAMIYQPLIIDFGLPDATKYFPRMFAAEPVVIIAVSTPIQLFFAWRIKLLTKSNVLFGVITLFSLASAVGGTWTTIRIVQVKLFSRKPELHTSALVWFLAAVVADFLITTILVMNLSKRKTGFSQTDDAIAKIIRMTVQTGMLTAFFAVGDVVFFMTLPHTALNFLWDLALSKLYANCLLSTLNARSQLQDLAYASNHRYPSNERVKGSGGRRIQGDLADSQGRVFSSPVYELNNAGPGVAPVKPYERDSDDLNLEYGITITKVIERVPDMPLHSSHSLGRSTAEGPTQ